MGFKKIVPAIIFLLVVGMYNCNADEPRRLLNTGWNELVKDNDSLAFRLFGKALAAAEESGDKAAAADALLMMGICSYSVSLSEGLHYALEALDAYKKLETFDSVAAKSGRARCLQLISTIYGRQGKWKETIRLSHEVIEGSESMNDTAGVTGLAFNSIGNAYQQLGVTDSVAYYFRKGLEAHLKNNNIAYLPASFINVADLELKAGRTSQASELFNRALIIADSTGNKQALVQACLGLHRYFLKTDTQGISATMQLDTAESIALQLTDKAFLSKVYAARVAFLKSRNDYQNALQYQEKLNILKDNISVAEKERVVRQLEVQFEVSEMNRQLKLTRQEHEITKLTNYLLWGALTVLLLTGCGIFFILRKMTRREKQLLETKVALMQAKEEQKKLKEEQMQHEIEFKESQLSAMALQMMQKNDLLKELEQKLGHGAENQPNSELRKIISKGWNQDNDWNDFNTVFEGINHNFYARLKSAYPEISPNDLRLCALIKLNMSIKEMAGILNISPDSVKTARYRLRKKLQLNTEDNLTEFIISL